MHRGWYALWEYALNRIGAWCVRVGWQCETRGVGAAVTETCPALESWRGAHVAAKIRFALNQAQYPLSSSKT